MSGESVRNLTIHEDIYQFPGKNASIRYQIIQPSLALDQHSQPSILYMHGYAEGPGSTADVIENAANQGLAVTAVKVAFSDMKGVGSFDTKKDAVEHVGRELIPKVMQDHQYLRADGLAHSMGALMMGMGLDETDGEYIKDVAVVNGMGFTVNEAMGKVYPSRSRFLAQYGIALATGSSPIQNHYGRALKDGALTIAKDLLVSRTFPAQLAMANETDIIPAYVAHAQRGNTVHVLSGDKDVLFNTAVVQENLTNHNNQNIHFEGVPGLPHQDAGLHSTQEALARALRKLS